MNITSYTLLNSINKHVEKTKVLSVTLEHVEHVTSSNYPMLVNNLSVLCNLENLPSLEEYTERTTNDIALERTHQAVHSTAIADIEKLLMVTIHSVRQYSSVNGIKEEHIDLGPFDELSVMSKSIKNNINDNIDILKMSHNLKKITDSMTTYYGHEAVSRKYCIAVTKNAIKNLSKIDDAFDMLNNATRIYRDLIVKMKKYIDENMYPETSISSIINYLNKSITHDINVLILSIVNDMDGMYSDGYIEVELEPIDKHHVSRLSLYVDKIPEIIHQDEYGEVIDTNYFNDVLVPLSLSEMSEELVDSVIPVLSTYDHTNIYTTINDSMEMTLNCGKDILLKAKKHNCVDEIKMLALLNSPLKTLNAFTSLAQWLITNKYKNLSCLKDTISKVNILCNKTLQK